MSRQQEVSDIIGPVIVGMGYEYVGCELLAQGRHSLLRVYMDKAGGVMLDDCAAVGAQLGALLDVEDPIKAKYTLEVSSPGLNRPLFTLEHFQDALGQEIKVRLSVPLDKRSRFQGIIKSVTETDVIIHLDGDEVKLPFASIAKANIVFKFD